jgi:hypothetical protein
MVQENLNELSDFCDLLTDPEQLLLDAITTGGKPATLIIEAGGTVGIKKEETEQEQEQEDEITRLNKGPSSYHIVLYHHLTKFDSLFLV